MDRELECQGRCSVQLITVIDTAPGMPDGRSADKSNRGCCSIDFDSVAIAMIQRCSLSTLLFTLFASIGVGVANAAVVVTAARSTAVDKPSLFAVDDVLVAYRPHGQTNAEAQPIVDALSFRLLILDDLLYGPLDIRVQRGQQDFYLALVDGQQEISVRSQDSPSELEQLDDRWLAAYAKKDWDEAKLHEDAAMRQATPAQRPLVYWRMIKRARAAYDFKLCRARASEARADTSRPMLRVHYSEEESHCASFAGDWRDAQKIQLASLAELDQFAPDTFIYARLAANLAQIESFSDYAAADQRIEAAVNLARKHCAGCADLGVIMNFLGDVKGNGNHYDASERAYAEGIAIARQLKDPAMALAPRLRMHARSLRMLGRIKEADAELKEALAMVKSAGVPAKEQGPFLNGLGVVAAYAGDFLNAARWFREAIALYDPTDTSVPVANARHNLGWTWQQSGDLAAAEREMRAATEIMAKNDQGATYASFLSSYAEVLSARGDPEAALKTIDEAVQIHRRVNATSYDAALCLIKQANYRAALDQHDAAQASWNEAFKILETIPQDNFMLADPLTERGYAELAGGEKTRARATFERAINLYRAQTKGSLALSRALQGAGVLARSEARLVDAKALLQEALDIRKRDVPNSAQHAETVHELGLLARAEKQPEQARTLLCQAASMLDDASLRVGGAPLDQARFRALFAEIYRDCVLAQVEVGHATAALEALERGRARGFRAALEMRQLQLRDPKERAALDELAINLAGEQEALSRAQDATLDAQQKKLAVAQATALKAARRELRLRLERALPSLSARKQAELAARLDPAEAYIAFSIGHDQSAVIVLRHEGNAIAAKLPITSEALSAQVNALRQLLNDPSRNDAWQLQADRLRRQLFGPILPALDGVQTISISPDGALHNLPFAALWDQDASQYWVDRYAITIVDALSARSLPSTHQHRDGIELLAVGDPVASAQPSAFPSLDAELRRSGASGLRPLPAARREVEQLAERYQRGAEVLLGSDASEAKVRRLAPQSRQLHFAVHALLDPTHVLDSSLVLYPGQAGQSDDDGFLRVHEIMTDLKLDAELVVLSACDTGLGKELAGEGLLGFSRAFAFAGTKATLASLWPVSDQSTETLMNHFYAARDRGQSAAEALQTAMRENRKAARELEAERRGVGGLAPVPSAITANPEHPFFWAAFQVYGE